MGEQAIAPLAFGTVLVDQMQPVSYHELIIVAMRSPGRHYYLQTQSLEGFQTETIEALIEQGLPLPSIFTAINIHHFHGAASRVGVSETAFALRQDHLMVELIAAWGATGRRAAVYPMGTEPLTGTSTLCFQRGDTSP